MVSIPDVPDSSASLLAALMDAVGVLPEWAGSVIELGGEVLLVAVAAGWLRLWAAARFLEVRAIASVAAVPVAAVVAWAVSEPVKSVMRVDRPCRLLRGFPAWADCPAPGDWSFPSNHAAIAGALVVGAVMAARQVGAPVMAGWVVSAGVAAASSRVLAGAHFPHDVVAGFVLGGMVAFVTVTVLGSLTAPGFARWRAGGRMRPLLGPGPASSDRGEVARTRSSPRRGRVRDR